MPTPTPTPSPTPDADPQYKTLLVPNADSLSQAIDLNNMRLLAIKPPASLTTASAKVAFYTAPTLTGTYSPIKPDGTLYTVAVSTTNDAWITLDWTKMHPYRFVKVKILASDGTTAVAQGADRTFLWMAGRAI